MANQPSRSRQLDRTTDQQREQRGLSDYEQLCAIQAAAGTNYANWNGNGPTGGYASHVGDRRDVLWLCAELRNAWARADELEELLERARATAAGLALQPDATTLNLNDEEWAWPT